MTNSVGELVQEDNKISEALLTSFFPPLPNYPPVDPVTVTNQLPITQITAEEIKQAVFKAASLKTPGWDHLPALI